MKFAAIASDEAILPVLQAAQLCQQCEKLSLWAESGDLLARMRSMAPQAEVEQSWEEALSGETVDAVLVAGVDESVLIAARQFAQAGFRLIVAVSPSSDAVRFFDYTAIWQESTDRVVPIFLSDVELVARNLQAAYNEDVLGKLWKIEFDRTIPMEENDSTVASDVARRWFLLDSAWLRILDPDSTHVNMLATGPHPDQPVEVTIRLTGEDAIDSRWTLRCGSHESWTLKLIGENGQISVRFEAGQLSIMDAPYEIALSDASDLVLHNTQNQLQRIVNGETDRDWTDVIKLGEFGATAARSLLKRRTLPVHFEEASERSQFKSQMTAVGCGVLLWTMFGMIALLTIGAISDPRDREYLISSSADFVIRTEEFADGESTLTAIGTEHVDQIASQWSSSSPVVIVEAEVNSVSSLNQQRHALVVSIFKNLKIREPEQRVVSRPIHGQWFETAMTFGWIVVFAPLGLALLAQILLVVSRPAE